MEGGGDVENQKKHQLKVVTPQSPKISARSDSFVKLNEHKINQSVLSYDPNDPDDFDTQTAIGMIFVNSISPIIGSLFHPTYMLVNAMILGQIKLDDQKCAAAGNDEYHPDCISA